MDLHREANYSSLFSQLDCGACKRPFNSGGSGDRGAHAGAYSTYWNIESKSVLPLPPADFGPLLNLIGFVKTNKTPDSPYQWLIEEFVHGSLCPTELHDAMKARRLKKQ